MVLLFLVLVGAATAGWMAGGNVRNLADLTVNAPWLALLAFALQAAVQLWPGSQASASVFSVVAMTGSLVAVAVFLTRNAHLPGLWLIASGFVLNALVIGANGGMPVDPEAVRALGGNDIRIEQGTHRMLAPSDRFQFLADVIPIPGIRTVVSAGDILLSAGLGLLVAAQMRRYPRGNGKRVRPKPVPVWHRVRNRSAAKPGDGG